MSQSADPFIRYLGEAAELRHAIKLNESDTLFAQGGGKIHYVLDSNVVRMFMDPSQHTSHLGALASWLDRETRVSTVTMTAEYLLSGNLPGQVKGEPALISPDHFGEIIGFATRLSHRLDALSDDEYDRLEQEMKARGNELDKLALELDRSDISTQDKSRALLRTLPEKVAEIVRGPLAEAIQLKRCVEAGAIARIDSRAWFDAGLLESSPRIEAEWFGRIRRARGEIERQRYGANRSDLDRNSLTINQLSDARTLAILSKIVEASREDEAADRCLLVTADLALRRAVEEYVAEHGEAGSLESGFRIFVRHPREFVPLLNLSNMSGDPAMLEVFTQLKVVLDELLVGIDLGEEDDSQAVANSGEIDRSLAVRGSKEELKSAGRGAPGYARAKLEEFQGHWSRASALAFSMNIERMQARDKVMFDAIAEVVRGGDLRTHGRDLIIGDLRRLLQEHAGLTVEGVFSAVREATRLRASVDSRALVEMRAPLHLFVADQFADIIGPGSFIDYLRLIASGSLGYDPTDAIARRVAEPHVQLFLACVCLAIGRWRAARDFAGRAIENAPPAPSKAAEIFDARYVYAMALRFTLASAGDFHQAEMLLNECAAHHASAPGQRREWVRARVETAALIVAAVLQSEALRRPSADRGDLEPLVEPAKVTAQLDRAAEILGEAQRWIDEDESADEAIWSGLRRQINTNLAAILVLTRLMKPGIGSLALLRLIDIGKVADGLDEPLEPGETLKYTTGIYRRLVGSLLSSTEERPAEQRRALEEIAAVLNSGLPLPPYDQVSLEWYQDRLAADAGGRMI